MSCKNFFRRCGLSMLALGALTLFPAGAQTAFFWTNNVSSNWSDAANWTNETGAAAAPVAAGQADYGLHFNKTGTYAASNNLNNGFLLNQLNFGGATVTLTGNRLAFTNNGAAQPQINQNAGVAIPVTNNLVFGNNVAFGGSGNGGVTLHGVLSGPGSLTKNGSGNLTIKYGTNTYSGGTVINTGTLTLPIVFATTVAPIGPGPLTVNSSGTLALDRTYVTNAITFNGGTVSGGNSFSSTLAGPMTLATSPTFSFIGGFGLPGNMSGPAGFIKAGTTTVPVTGSNTFTGPVSVTGGTLAVGSFNSVSGGTPASNLGAPTTAANGTIFLGTNTTPATLIYTGPGETTDRIIKLAGSTGGASLMQAGNGSGLPVTQTGQSGLLKFTSNLSVPGVAGADNRKTLTLTNSVNVNNVVNSGYNMGRGEIAGSIGDSLVGNSGQLATSLTKDGVGIWILSGSNTYSGVTKVRGGRLVCTRASALGTNSLDILDEAKVQLDYVGTRQIGALTLNGGAARPNGTYGSSSSPATFTDDFHFAGIGTVTVGPIASPTTNTLALTGGSNPSAGGATLTFIATVTGGNTPSGNVIFYDGLTVIGSNTLNGSFQAQLSTSLLTNGAHTITAFYVGNSSNAPSASVSLSQTVVDTRPATTTTLALTGGSNPSSLGAAVTYTATVTGASPTGVVNFYDGTSFIGGGTLNGSFQASLTTSNLPPGWHGLLATYVGDANNAPSTTTSPRWQNVKPPPGNGKLKVFILAGQSNMQGKGQVETGRNPNNLYGALITNGWGSMRNMLNSDPNMYGYLADTNSYANTTNTTVPGWRTLTNVWVSYFTSGATASATQARKGYLDADFGDGARQGRIGPEYGFGLVVGSQLGDPVLIIKTAWGGNSLTGNFRPPSSGGTVGDAYSNMVANVHYILNNLDTQLTNFAYDPVAGYEIAGFGWHQGWNDINQPQIQYETNLVNLIRDVRAEFGVPNLPVAIGVTGMASASGNQLLICAAQAVVANPVLHPELAGTVFTVDTRPFDYGLLLGAVDQGYHWFFNGKSQFQIGQSMGLGMMQLLSAQASVTNKPAGSVTTNSAALNANVIWPFTPCSGVVYWDTVNHGTNAGAWPNSALVSAWTNSTTTYQYGLAGDYVLAGGPIVTLAATNLSFNATGLASNTTYYFTFAATNRTVSSLSLTNVQTLWATNVQSFTTLSVTIGTPPTPLLPGDAITVTGGVPSFTFATVAGYKYRLVYKNTLTDSSWSPVIAPPNYPSPDGWSAVSTGAAMSISDNNTAGQPQRFYRIEAANP